MRTILTSRVLVLLLLTPSLFLGQAWAQSAGELSTTADFIDHASGTSKEEMVAQAIAESPQLKAARQEIAISRGQVNQARLRRNPTLDVGGVKQVDGDDNQVTVVGSFPLELFGRRARRTDVAEQRVTAAQLMVADKERLLSATVKSRYVEALAAIRNLEFIEELLRLNREFLSLLETRVRDGASAPLDADQVRVEVGRIETLAYEYSGKTELAVLALKQAVGLLPEAPLKVRSVLENPEDYRADNDELLRIALENRPDLKAAQALEQVSDAQIRMEASEGKPDAEITGGYQRSNLGFSLRAFDSGGNLLPIRETFNYATFGLRITLPAFDRRQGAVAATSAALEQARAFRAATELRIRHEVKEARIRYERARSKATIYTRLVRGQAQKNLQVVRQIYSYGRVSLLDLVAEQRRYIDIETGYTDILRELNEARIGLELAIASPVPEERK